MSLEHRDTLRDLLRRVDEVRGLGASAASASAIEPEDTEALLRTVSELVEELEKSHRRLIETNVQLVSLREVASSMVSSLDTGETTRTVTRYLHRAFGFEDAFLLLIDRERMTLAGTWTWGRDGREHSHRLELPLQGAPGGLTRSLWLNRTVHLHDPQRHPIAQLPEGHTLQETLSRLGSVACVPLQRSQSLPVAETHELCGRRCVLGDASILAPPPGAEADSWAHTREQGQRHCLGCDLLPILGVIGMARAADAPPLTAADVALLESIALSVAPVVENARLYQELRKSERFRLHVVDSMASALVAVNMDGEILTFNHAAEELLGFGEADVRGHAFGALFGEEGEALLRGTLEHGQECVRVETLLRSREGTPVPVSFTTSLLRSDRRAVYGAIATFVDLTPLKRAEEHARSQDRLAALGRFTSSVAHEIRNPLTGIAAGVQYLARALSDGPQRENLDFILSEIRRLDRIVQDLFDITHARALHRRVAPLEESVRRAVQSLEPDLAARGITVTVEVAPFTPPVPHDADNLQQVFINLIKNAAEASPDGSAIEVAIAVKAPPRRGRAREPGAVVARVSDHGSGITAEDLKTIFEPFFTTKAGGTGLGLYVCHEIVKRHAGSLSAQSDPGQGTTFSLELPIDVGGGNS
ncbi:MAG TPA: ATP-binding protein [Candidatus Eisenbacteria bacterium]|nr:ATP-binding protein [Candidatus Eisenbacteria bacterium]